MRSTTLLVALASNLGAAAAAEPAPSELWVKVARSRQGSSFVDRLSFERAGNVVRFDERLVLKRRQADGVTTIKGSWEMDCVRRVSRLLSFTAHRADGSTVSGFSFAEQFPVQPVPPGSNNEKTLEFVCSTPASQPGAPA